MAMKNKFATAWMDLVGFMPSISLISSQKEDKYMVSFICRF